ncbi:unnamed protein product [Hyaloperonospora brassicae]|uniref:RxLR effector candidate protein n=1 Tax=Hyaloperonospora brassicae TaxID=162125 RepID=A0AAV0T8B7_HYABA|nr:unnamed protein product [Hyaloperonospora brassicae]
MRVHYLAFLASSALSARVDGVVEPGASNQTALYFPAAVRPSIASDDDVTATRSPTRVGPPHVEERGLSGTIVSSALSKLGSRGKSMVLARAQDKFYNLQKKSIRDNDVEHSLRNALKTKAWDDLYDRYKLSGHLMIDDLTKHYGDEMIARVLSRALRADSINPAKFATATTLKEKLALDQLTRWQTKEKTLDDVFHTLRLNHLDFTPDALAHIALLKKNLEVVVFARMMRSRKMNVLENYSKLTAPQNSEVAYLRALMKGFGGEKNSSSCYARRMRTKL